MRYVYEKCFIVCCVFTKVLPIRLIECCVFTQVRPIRLIDFSYKNLNLPNNDKEYIYFDDVAEKKNIVWLFFCLFWLYFVWGGEGRAEG